MTLPFETYRKALRVDQEFKVNDLCSASERQISCTDINSIIDELLEVLIAEADVSPGLNSPKGKLPKVKRRLLQSLLTVWPPLPLTDRFFANMDRLQKWETSQKIIQMQGHPEKTGQVKITRGYHLPSPYVLHTVGPVYAGPQALANQTVQLASCYQSCLDSLAL